MSAVALRAQDGIVLRPAEAGDRNYVLSSWLRSHRSDSGQARRQGPDYWERHHRVVEALLGRAATMVACWSDDPDVIIGWACTEDRTVHYVYVRKEFRRMGIARMLLEPMLREAGVQYTHTTNVVRMVRMPKGWTYNAWGVG